MTKDEKEAASSAAALFGRMGGLIGGKARAKSLTAKRRREIAVRANKASIRARRLRIRRSAAKKRAKRKA
jgi:hypothetical protein